MREEPGLFVQRQNGVMQQFRSITLGNHNPFPGGMHRIKIEADSQIAVQMLYEAATKNSLH